MKKTLSALAAGALLSVAGLAGAAEPLQLSDSQMDAVAAGQTSVATSSGFALIGVTASGAQSSSYAYYTLGSVTRITTAGAASIGTGALVLTTASAGSGF